MTADPRSHIADLRERIAQDIEAYGNDTHPKHGETPPCLRCDIHAAYMYAARIARGQA